MKKRWIIRSLCLLPLVCVVGFWVTSYFVGMALARRQTKTYVFVAAVQGQGVMGEERGPGPVGPAFLYRFDPDMIHNHPDLETTAGFYFGVGRLNPGSFLMIFPLWLPTVLLSALFWFVWRKTRAKIPAEKAFPVEPGAKSGESSP